MLTQNTFSLDDAKKATQQLLLSEAKIRLLINPREEDHSRLVELLHKALFAASSPKRHGETDEQAAMVLRDHVGAIVELSQSILKREWERIKRGI